MFDAATKIRQKRDRKWLLLFSVLTIFLMSSAAAAQSVVLYDNPNFGGRSRAFGIGEYRLFNTEDFNDMASSIKVPEGLVAIVFEHADEGGGYGIWVDFLEDQPDLSRYNFNDKISYLKIFSRRVDRGDGSFIYARNSMQNGEFIPGHWEGVRRRGNPINPTVVVGPAMQPNVPTTTTVLQPNGPQTIIATLGVQSSNEAANWNDVEYNRMGVRGSDYRGQEEIGSAAFQRASFNRLIPDFLNFWYPQKVGAPSGVRDHRGYHKHALSGIVDAKETPYVVNIDGTYRDYDFTVHIAPSENYLYLVKDGHPPELWTFQGAQILAMERENPYGDCDKPFTLVEAEIDAPALVKRTLNLMVRQRIGKQISVYGPWIYDRGHCHHPEIHPAEQIWWSEDVGSARRYNLNLFCDSSQRFWWRRQMDDGTKLKPWGAPPIKGTFAISFEAEVGRPGRKFEVNSVHSSNVASFPGSAPSYDLVYQNKILVSFIPHNDAFKVSYEQVGLKPGTTNVVRGLLVIETSVGKVTQIATRVGDVNIPQGANPNDLRSVPQEYEEKAFKKEAGHYMFTIMRTDMP